MLYNITEFLWGIPLTVLIICVGMFLTVGSGFFQIRKFGLIFKKTVCEALSKEKRRTGGNSAYSVLCTVLSGTVGSGNIAGVATAIAVGGPGAVFWMWIIAIGGMMTKMAEVTLSVHFRRRNPDGSYFGGPMYYMKNGLKKVGGVLAVIYSIALLVYVLTDACFVQINTLATTAKDVFNIPMLASGIIVVGFSAIVILSGGFKHIGKLCSGLFPIMVLVYIIGTLGVIFANITSVPDAFRQIFVYAFSPAPAVGGFTGAAVSLTMSKGASRGIFSNEAGMGTAATVHATADTDHPVHQGMYGVMEVFIDTIVICTLTALAVIASGVWCDGNTGSLLVMDAFEGTWGNVGTKLLGIAIILFTYSSYIGFFVEFKTALSNFFREKVPEWLDILFFALPILSVTMEIEEIWNMADMAVGFVAIPNLTALVILSPLFFRLTREYVKKQIK